MWEAFSRSLRRAAGLRRIFDQRPVILAERKRVTGAGFSVALTRPPGGGHVAAMPEAPKRTLGRGLLIKFLVAAALLFVVAVLVLRGVNLRFYWDEGMAVIQRAGPWVFFTAMALLPAVGAPLLAFVIPAGPAFSEQLGLGGVILACAVALAVNLTLTYWVARRALRPLAERLVARMGYQIPQINRDEQLEVALLLRITPGPPFFLQNYILGLGNVAFATYLAVSWSVVFAQVVGVVVFGDALVHGKARLAVLGICLLVAAAIVVHLVRKHYGKGRVSAEH